MSERPGRRRRPRQDVPTDPAAPQGPEEIAPPEDPEAVARQILLRRLTEQPRSRAELAGDLAKRHVPDQVAGRLLDRFEQVGLVDDKAFAQAWVESRHRGRGLARRALADELRRKGVADEVAREAVGSLDDENERATARRLVDRKLVAFGRLGRLDRARVERRLVAMLARKGYGQGLAFSVVRAAIVERDSEPAASGDTSDTSGTMLDLR